MLRLQYKNAMKGEDTDSDKYICGCRPETFRDRMHVHCSTGFPMLLHNVKQRNVNVT
jgi:hypothetical protein